MTFRSSSPDHPCDARIPRGIITAAECVLFDFDGPIASLFGNHRAHEVARVLLRRLSGWGLAPLFIDPDDPIQVIRDTAVSLAGSPEHYRVAELERLLGEQEIHAARSAVPTDHAYELIEQLVKRGTKVAVTTNNSAAAVNAYLERAGLAPFFGSHVHGRLSDPALMKPDPACLLAGLRSTGGAASNSLMIGDSESDFAAARAAGVGFLGYARDDAKDRRLREAGARHVVHSFKCLIDADL
ncbi:HAD family hydrolase [Streptomyces sp. RKAG337]|uniref:HAD family hydrolase n=1 Tax=Streptomyces sp. RKAG337 TaxID=2893404 RepID=UPI002033C364|nr:HAD family hydrolase [Streptomyces sp. RKAG337]MCM2427048.1 HAD family hydrolase [Streptomyces sp. RKAG337]